MAALTGVLACEPEDAVASVIAESRNPGIPKSRNPEIPKCRSAEVPKCRSAEVPKCRSAGVPECRSAGVPFRWSGEVIAAEFAAWQGERTQAVYAFRQESILLFFP